MASTSLQAHTVAAPTNEETAQLLDEVAGLLEAQRAKVFRAMAYRRAASAVRALRLPVAEAAAGGSASLMAALGVGPRLARTIAEIIATGRLGLLDRLRGGTDPKLLLTIVTGIGPELADRIHQTLGVETIEELEMAAHDGRLATVRGFGQRRVRGVTDALTVRLGRRAVARRPRSPLPRQPLLSCSTLTVSTGKKRRPDVFGASHHGASIPAARPGCRSPTPSAAPATTPRSSRTRRAHTSAAAPATGW
jgi:hypothetical protein